MINLDNQECDVRPHTHFLEQPPLSENALIWPYAIQIPWCSGSCSVHHEIVKCKGKQEMKISLSTYKLHYSSSRKRRDVMQELAKMKGIIIY